MNLPAQEKRNFHRRNSQLFQIRSARPEDEAKLYEISLRTALAGKDATATYENPRLVGDKYVIPYLRFSPQLSFVVETQGEVSGFCVGTSDTKAYEQNLLVNWWPNIRHHYALPDNTSQQAWSVEDHEIDWINDPIATPEYLVDNFPAHVHMNLLPSTRGQGVGTKLLSHWFDSAASLGASTVHLGANPANKSGIEFWRSRGFVELNETGSLPNTDTIWMGRKIDQT